MLSCRRPRHRRTLASPEQLAVHAAIPLGATTTLYVLKVEEQTVAVATDASGLRHMILLSPDFPEPESVGSEGHDVRTLAGPLELSSSIHNG
ncbi:MAG: hypothetical protein RMJ88_03320 [Thermogemmata sp.]|nr:hypothetical protein [Thermogemmata sp.]